MKGEIKRAKFWEELTELAAMCEASEALEDK